MMIMINDDDDIFKKLLGTNRFNTLYHDSTWFKLRNWRE